MVCPTLHALMMLVKSMVECIYFYLISRCAAYRLRGHTIYLHVCNKLCLPTRPLSHQPPADRLTCKRKWEPQIAFTLVCLSLAKYCRVSLNGAQVSHCPQQNRSPRIFSDKVQILHFWSHLLLSLRMVPGTARAPIGRLTPPTTVLRLREHYLVLNVAPARCHELQPGHGLRAGGSQQ